MRRRSIVVPLPATGRGQGLGNRPPSRRVSTLPEDFAKPMAELRQHGLVQRGDSQLGASDGAVVEVRAHELRDRYRPVGRVERKKGDAAAAWLDLVGPDRKESFECH